MLGVMAGYRRRFLLYIIETKTYAYLLKHVIWRVRITTYYTNFPGWKYHWIYKRIQPGDIILATDAKKLTSMLIPGEWTHAAVCVSKNQRFEVAEMVHTGFRKSTVSDICYEATKLVILRPRFDDVYRRRFITNVLNLDGADYDIKFDLGVKGLYCSELIYQADTEHRLGISLDDLAGLGKPYVSPTGILNAEVDVIADSRKLS